MRFGPRATQLLLLGTSDPRTHPDTWHELSYGSGASLRLQRTAYPRPVRALGLRVWWELAATNVPLDAKLSKVGPGARGWVETKY